MRVAWAVPAVWTALAAAAFAEEAFPMKGEIRLDTPLAAWGRADEGQPPGPRVRVALYNIENFTDAVDDGPDRTPELFQAQARWAAGHLAEIDADLVFVLEIENATALRALNDALPRPYPSGYVTQLGDGAQDRPKLNLALLSRLPLADVRELDFGPLQGAGRPARGSLRATVDLGDGHRLVVYSAHLKSNFGYRPRNMYQRRHALQLITRDAKALVQQDPALKWELLVVGDMNVDPELPEFARDWSLSPLRGWKDLWRGRPIHERMTIPTRYGDAALEFPPACFDRIYAGADLTNFPWVAQGAGSVQKGTHTKNVKVLPGQEGHVSDHFPVYVDLVRDGAPAP